MVEPLGNLVGHACPLNVDDVKILGRTTKEVLVNFRAVLLRFIGRGLFLAARKLTLFATKV